jgi:predicted NUDIX family phosphoesterase
VTEEDPSFKQLIPYVIFRYTDPSGEQYLFKYTRGSGLGEQRLHSKCSVGVGGHISSVDGENAVGNPYEEGMRRELAEEVDIQTPYQQQIAGLINDDETEVGRVHLGVVHVFDVEQPEVFPREDDMINTGFVKISQLLAQLDTMESWSRICVEALFGER